MNDFSQMHLGAGDNIRGDKYSINLLVKIDVGRLTEILQTNSKKIRELFKQVEVRNQDSEMPIDERTIPIDEKNRLNDLRLYYDKFIKEHEGKLLALDNFFKENDYMENIESAATNLKRHIFCRDNQNTDKLDSATFDELIQDHTKVLRDGEDKDVMVLILYYLYRFCYVGEKNAG